MNASNLSTGSKLLLGGAVVLFIDLFLAWQEVCVELGELGRTCGSASGWEGIGVLVGLLTIAVIAWEVLQLLGRAPSIAVPAPLVSAALGAAVVVFGVIEFLSHDEARNWPAWVGLICLVVIAAGAFRRFNEAGGAAAVPRNLSRSAGSPAGSGSTPPAAPAAPPQGTSTTPVSSDAGDPPPGPSTPSTQG